MAQGRQSKFCFRAKLSAEKLVGGSSFGFGISVAWSLKLLGLRPQTLYTVNLNEVNHMNDAMDAPRVLTHRFGPNWKGQRCGAKTRAGGRCKKPASLGTPRCITHGARGGAPRGKAHGRYKTGEHTIEAVAARKLEADAARRCRARLRLVEQMGNMLHMFEGSKSRRRPVNEAKFMALKVRYEALLDPLSEAL